MPEAGHLSGFCRGQGVSAGHSREFFSLPQYFGSVEELFFAKKEAPRSGPKRTAARKEFACNPSFPT
jgi:hypothetical protein